MVPVYPPTATSNGTFIDGAFSDNLPAQVLRQEGVRLVIACNAMSPPPMERPWPPLLPGRAGRFIADFNLARRVGAVGQGVRSLAYAGGQASGEIADVSFQVERPYAGFTNLGAIDAIAREALMQPALWATVDRAAELYKAL